MKWVLKNELSKETSPYLKQHAHNPVHWQVWSNDILAIAKDADRPILISIGYSACHWCHVMEKESFEDTSVAEFMNDKFINIKIDREERPDLDQLYMEAVQILTGSGGWPLNVFLTPDGEPFFGGTYFPPKSMFNRASWIDTLHFVDDIWKHKREEVEHQAKKLTQHIRSSNDIFITQLAQPKQILHTWNQEYFKKIMEQLMLSADLVNGGFGSAPKFPQLLSIQYLLHYYHHYKEESALNHATLSLESMLNGGIYDHLSGGLSRYSTDEKWLVPHFEKMLYDNALLVIVLCDAFQVTRNHTFAKAIEHTLQFCINELKSESGGYYTAIDADSEGEEGKFYVWRKTDIDNVLLEDSSLFCAYYGVTEYGNWDGVNILNQRNTPKDFLTKYNCTAEELDVVLNRCRAKLSKARSIRERPSTDEKIVLSNNALLITALSKAASVLQNDQYKIRALDLFDCVQKMFLQKAEHYYHCFTDKQHKYVAYLDDLSYYIQACIQLQEVTGNQSFLMEAKQMTDYVITHFQQADSNFFYYTHKAQKDILVRKVDIYDSTSPSGNSTMAENLYYLSHVFDIQEWRLQAENMSKQICPIAQKYPASFGKWCTVALNQHQGIFEIVITGEDPYHQIYNVLNKFIPNKIVQIAHIPGDFPLLKHKEFNSNTNYYICKDGVCKQAVTDISAINLDG